jgi:hypothetical protein
MAGFSLIEFAHTSPDWMMANGAVTLAVTAIWASLRTHSIQHIEVYMLMLPPLPNKIMTWGRKALFDV